MTKTYEELVIECAFENLLETKRINAITNQSKARLEKQLSEDTNRAEFLRRQILKDIAERSSRKYCANLQY